MKLISKKDTKDLLNVKKSLVKVQKDYLILLSKIEERKLKN
jgi:hypothetical protein